jgi:hypothetical protein
MAGRLFHGKGVAGKDVTRHERVTMETRKDAWIGLSATRLGFPVRKFSAWLPSGGGCALK